MSADSPPLGHNRQLRERSARSKRPHRGAPTRMQINRQHRSRALQARRQEHAFAIQLLQNLVVPTFALDQNGKVLIWNMACERLTGLPAVEVIGTTDHWRGFYDTPRPCLADLVSQDRTGEGARLYSEQYRVGDGPHELYAETWCVIPRIGVRKCLAINASPIYDSTGRVIAVVETLRDITIQKSVQHELELLATSDGLTGILNRRSFDKNLVAEWRRALRDAKPLALLMVDVDNFKNYNDKLGHQAGDVCLKHLASIMAAMPLRSSDCVARYGGEEFVIILTDADLQGAASAAERLRASIEQFELPVAEMSGRYVTVSIGVASLIPRSGDTPEKLLSIADAALYKAKDRGRNTVVAIDANLLESALTLQTLDISL